MGLDCTNSPMQMLVTKFIQSRGLFGPLTLILRFHQVLGDTPSDNRQASLAVILWICVLNFHIS